MQNVVYIECPRCGVVQQTVVEKEGIKHIICGDCGQGMKVTIIKEIREEYKVLGHLIRLA